MAEKLVYCYNPRFELMPREELREFQLNLLKRQARYVYNFSELAREKFDNAGVKPADINSLEDLSKIPVTVREEIEEKVDKGNPYGGICCAWTEGRECVVYQFLKGWPPAKPVYSVLTIDDFFSLTEQFVRNWRMLGVGSEDIVLYQHDAVRGDHLGIVGTTSPVFKPNVAGVLKCSVSPIVRFLPTDPPRVVQHSRFFHFSTSFLFPECLASVEDICKKEGISPKDFGYKKLVVQNRGGEGTLKESDRERLKEIWGCEVYSLLHVPENVFYALECSPGSGLHFWEDAFVVEVLDEKDQPLPPGKTGKLTITNLFSEGSPIMRYKTNVNVSLKEDKCTCGRTHARIIPQE